LSYPGAPVAWPYAISGSQPELKYRAVAINDLQLYHNVAALVGNSNLLMNIAPGSDVANRIGSKVFLKDVKIRMILNNKSDRPNVSYRVVLVAVPTSAESDSFVEVFRGGSFTAPFLPTAGLLLHDQTFPKNQGTTMVDAGLDRERSHLHEFSVTVNQAVSWHPTTGVALTSLMCYIIPYDAHATLQTDNIASAPQVTVFLSFTDA
jgi:hypothetical protein